VENADQAGFAVWITGLPASGKTTVATALSRTLRGIGIKLAVLESDALRQAFPSREAYNELDREYFYASLAFIGRILTEHGVSVIFDATANRRSYRDRARHQIGRFVEVFIECPLEICMRRDPKGIYRRAREGQADHVPGLQTVYEPPEEPDVVIRGDQDDPEQGIVRILDILTSKHFLKK